MKKKSLSLDLEIVVANQDALPVGSLEGDQWGGKFTLVMITPLLITCDSCVATCGFTCEFSCGATCDATCDVTCQHSCAGTCEQTCSPGC